MDIIFLQMVNASHKNLKTHSPFVRLAPPRSDRLLLICAGLGYRSIARARNS